MKRDQLSAITNGGYAFVYRPIAMTHRFIASRQRHSQLGSDNNSSPEKDFNQVQAKLAFQNRIGRWLF